MLPESSPRASITIPISASTILKTLAVIVGVGVAWLIRDILLLIFSSALLAGVIYPYVQWAAQYKIPKTLSVVALYLLIFLIMALAFGLLVPALITEMKAFVTSYGSSWGWLRDYVGHLYDTSTKYGFADNLQTSVDGLRVQVTNAVTGAFSTLTDAFDSIASFVVVLVLALYIILEEAAIKDVVHQWIPIKYQAFASEVTWRIIQRLGAWVRAQLVLGLIISICYFVSLSIIGVPYALLLAMIGGLLEFIPYVGPIVSAFPIVLLALTISPARAVIALIVMIVIHQIESHVIVPKVMQKTIGLNPIISIVAFLVGAKLFGIVGAIFSIPLATAASVFLQEYMRFRKGHASA